MNDDIRMLVVSPAPEAASRVNSALRGAGIVAQVEWARDADDATALLETAYDLVFCELPRVPPDAVVAAAGKHRPPLPVIGIADEIDDELMTTGINAGLRDLVSLARSLHIAAVARRELQAHDAQRAVHAASADVALARRERDTLFEGSGDALARVEDGILVEANAAWGELFGTDGAQAGTPLMDLFDRESRQRLKAALRAARDAELELVAVGADGLTMPTGVSLRPMHGAAAGRMEIAIRSGRGQRTLAAELERAQRFDAQTGLLNRDAFVGALRADAGKSLLLVRIDQFARVIEQMGVIGSDAVAVQFAKLLASNAAGAQAGRLEGTMFGLLLDGDRAQVDAWCERARAAIGGAVFEHAGRSTPLTASFGIRVPDPGVAPEQRLDDALAALRKARAAGGNRVDAYAPDEPVHAPDAGIPDEEWAARLKRALVKGQFRLAFQPVASLHGDASEAHDSLLRLIDPEQGEILPGEFLPAAQRTGLMTAIDRWVIGEALRTLGDAGHRKKGTTLFVRLSDASLKDATLLKWLQPQVTALKLTPGRLVIEFSMQQAEKWLKETRALAAAMKSLGCGTLLGRFAATPAAAQLLTHLPLDYAKFDVAVFDGLARDQARQGTVKEAVEQATERGVRTIAPGIEDANTMALLWQLGVDFVQGNYLQEPEVVIAG